MQRICVVSQVFVYTMALHLIYQMNGWTGMPVVTG